MTNLKTYPEVDVIEGYLKPQNGIESNAYAVMIHSQIRIKYGNKWYLIPLITRLTSDTERIELSDAFTEFNRSVITAQTSEAFFKETSTYSTNAHELLDPNQKD